LNTRYLWIGLDVSCEHTYLDWVWEKIQLWAGFFKYSGLSW